MNSFKEYISKLAPLKVIDASIKMEAYISIDISNKNKALQNFDVSSSRDWEMFLEEYLQTRNAKVAYGGYLEVRDIYNRSTYFKSDTNQRNIHLGVDLWTTANTPVLAVLDGTIHSFQNNTNYGDYGPTIILEHMIENDRFYSLYGHLSLNSLNTIQVGQKVKQGEVIGSLGKASVNGDYAPHLHFQIIHDIQNYVGDYPGVCSEKEKPFFKENCPDPNLLLKLPS